VRATLSRRDVVPIAALLLIGSLAFTHLMRVPAFEDEGSQLRLIWRALEAGEWLAPLGDGKPLEAWPMVPLVRFAPHPLLAIRALHVVCGMLGAVLTYLLAAQIADRATALASGVLFATCPFVVYLERFAHSDIMMCTAGLWVLLSILRLMQSPTWRAAAALGIALVLAALAKLPVGFIFLTSMPLALLLMPAHKRRALVQPPALARVIAAHAPAALLALTVVGVAVVRLRRGQSPGFGLQDLIGIGMGHYHGIAAAIGVPRPGLIGELTAQLSWPVVALGVIGLVASACLNDWRARWLIVVGAAPMLGIGLLATFWFSRYLLFALPPLIVAAASGWRSLSLRVPRHSRAVGLAVLALCVGLMVRQSSRLVLAPLTASWSSTDRFQYFEGPGSGYGYPEAARFLMSRPDAPRMIYALDGHSAYQLRLYLPPAWSERVRPVLYADDGQTLRSEEARLGNLLSHTPAWIIVSAPLLQGYMSANFGRSGAEQVKLRQVVAFDKPGSRAWLVIYEAARR
jgi:4-amino-4-deoxy-L-arabinose transferase-like glycosyltransferase